MADSDDSRTDSSDLAYAKKKMELARLEESEMSPLIQSLTINEGQEDLYLLQLNPDILQHVTEGQVLTIRGNPDEPAVICTDTKTYELKEAETSNSLLLLPEISWPEESLAGEFRVVPRNICGIFHNYFELRNHNPSFKNLRKVLEAHAYRGPEHEDETVKKYTLEDLLDFIQASRAELIEALNSLHTCVIDGFIRILDFDYKFDVVCHIVNVMDSKSIPINRIPKNTIVEELQGIIPVEIINKCFQWFATEINEVDCNEEALYTLNEDLVCRLYGEILLRAAGKFNLNEFLASWQKSVPEGLTCNLAQLHGLALTDMNYSPEVIFHFPSDDMPENIAERFTKLFKVKEKWTFEEIVPYLEDKACAGTDVKSLLIKYTRESTKDGVKMYSSKW